MQSMQRNRARTSKMHQIGEKYNSPVKLEVLNEYLEGYDEVERKYLIEGFKWGFQLDFKGGRRNLEETKNLSCC